eukprot:scaffold12465_cov43-Attheya_sp.AAC.1
MPASELGKVEVLLVTPPRPKQTLTGKKHKGSVSRLSTAWIDRLPDHTQGGSELVGPKLIVLLQHPPILTYKDGSDHKETLRRLQTLGYESSTSYLRALDYGSAIDQEWCATIFIREESVTTCGYPQHPAPNGLPPRGMSNVLLPFGVPSWAWKHSKDFQLLTGTASAEVGPDTEPDDSWRILTPDLTEGGTWYCDCLRTLSTAIDLAYPDEDKEELMRKGRADLAVHRTN